MRAGVAGIGVGSTGPIDPETGVYGEVGTLPGWRGSPLAADLTRLFGFRWRWRTTPTPPRSRKPRGAQAAAAAACSTSPSAPASEPGSSSTAEALSWRGRRASGDRPSHSRRERPALLLRSERLLGVAGQRPGDGGLDARAARRSSRRDLRTRAPGDPLALEAVEREARYLGLGLANLVTIFCPQTIVLGGGMMHSADLLLAPALEVVKRTCTQVPVENTSIVLAGLGAQSGLLGAACVWFHRAGCCEKDEGEKEVDLDANGETAPTCTICSNSPKLWPEHCGACGRTRPRSAVGRPARWALASRCTDRHGLFLLGMPPPLSRLLKEGLTPVMVETGELIHYERGWLTSDTLVIAVSQSGRSVEIVRLLECARGRSEIIGVTNTPDSPLATAARPRC